MPSPLPQKGKTENKGHMICSKSLKLVKGSQDSNKVQSSSINYRINSFIRHKFIYSALILQQEVPCVETYGPENKSWEEKKMKGRPGFFPFLHRASYPCQKVQAWNILKRRHDLPRLKEAVATQSSLVFAIPRYKTSFVRPEFSKRNQKSTF